MMAKRSNARARSRGLIFGPNKYYAVNLLLARWVRHYAVPAQQYCYVTLGGTELRDVANIGWIDQSLASVVISYEDDARKAKLAIAAAESLTRQGFTISVVEGDIFCYERKIDLPHIFFVDLTGICKPIPYQDEFKEWFERDVVRPGDFLLVTSHLSRVKWGAALACYDSEFRELRSFRFEEKRNLYYRAHAGFVLRRALLAIGLEHELRLRPVGSVCYRDSSSMGLYGLLLEEGQTSLQLLVKNVPFWKTKSAS